MREYEGEKYFFIKLLLFPHIFLYFQFNLYSHPMRQFKLENGGGTFKKIRKQNFYIFVFLRASQKIFFLFLTQIL